MSLDVDQLELGPIGTNTYLVRASASATGRGRGRPERRRRHDPGAPSARSAPAAPRSSSRTATSTTSSASPTSPSETGAPVYAPAGERILIEEPAAFTPPGITVRGSTARRLARGRRDGRGRRHLVRRHARPGPLARAPRVLRRRRTSSRATCSSPARSAAPTFPGGDWDVLAGLDRIAPRRVPARHGRPSRPRPADDARRRARAEPVPRRPPRGTGSSDERQDRASARDARRRPRRDAALAARHRRGRAALRALRLPQGPDPRLRGHGALRAHVRAGLGRRAEGDVHLHRPLRPPAHAAARGNGADLPRVRRARHAARPAAGEAVHDRADVPLRHARARAATASTGRRRSRRSAPTTRRSTRSCSSSTTRCSTGSASRPTTSSSTRSAAATCRPAYLATLGAWLEENEHRLDADTRAKVATSPLRVFDNYLAKPEAVRAALDEAPKIGESLCEECVAHFAARPRRPRRDRRRLHARSDARPRARLLHPHDLGVHRADGQRELDHLGRRPLRRSRRGDRRAADAGRRLRRRPRAAR